MTINGLTPDYFERILSDALLNASQTFPVVLLTGPRQVGKTTLLEKCAALEEKRNYVTLDDPHERFLAKQDPRLFLQAHPPPVLIDEIQYAPELFPLLKMAVDTQKQPGLFWLTGSQQFHLMRNVAESLAGRVAILALQGFSQAEKFHGTAAPFVPQTSPPPPPSVLDLPQVYDIILRGSFPALFANPATNTQLFYSSYLQTYLERDVRDLLKAGDEHRFVQFVKVAAGRTGQLLNYSDMANDAGISVNTAKSWLSVLETSGLVFFLQPWRNNLSKRLSKTPELYFYDTGLCAFLAGWETSKTLSTGSMSGAMFETYVVSEIIKSHLHNGRRPDAWFYRDKEKREIDLLLRHDGLLHPIEIKRTASPGKSDIRHFEVMEKLNEPIGKGALICLYEKPMPLTASVDIIPVACLG
jgi:predicted AAA+ superfamily ATPase